MTHKVVVVSSARTAGEIFGGILKGTPSTKPATKR